MQEGCQRSTSMVSPDIMADVGDVPAMVKYALDILSDDSRLEGI